jgi:hypothetical protein
MLIKYFLALQSRPILIGEVGYTMTNDIFIWRGDAYDQSHLKNILKEPTDNLKSPTYTIF